jgi:glycerate 2-kinase
MREEALCRKGERIFQAALSAADPNLLVKKKLKLHGHYLDIGEKRFDLEQIRNIRVAAIGKAAPAMAAAVAEVLGEKLKEGIFLCRPKEGCHIACFRGLPAPHPLPDERSRTAARKILEMAEKSGADDLLLLCISGGGSAQLSYPPPEVGMKAKRELIQALLQAGADIHDLNTVRKHLSLIKGGQLALAAFPAAVVNLVISDVTGNDPSTIASGPGWGDASTFQEAQKILEKFNLWKLIPDPVRMVIREGGQGARQDTPDPGSPFLKRVFYIIAGDNQTALEAARRAAVKEELAAEVLTFADCGEAREKAAVYVEIFMARKRAVSRPLCLIAGGELTVRVRGNGKGGRNQEFVLAFLKEMKRVYPREKNWAVYSLGTDGIDGPTDAAGAGGGPSILDKAALRRLNPEDYLNNNDSYTFFSRSGGLIRTGPTQTNVMDIRLFLHG